MIRAFLTAAALLLAAGPSMAAEADSILTAGSRLNLTRLYTGPDGKSHAEPMTIDAAPNGIGGIRFIEADTTRVTLGAWPHGTMLDFHVANNRTILVALSGTLIVDLGDGKVYRLGPGQMALAEDRTGRGHKSGCDNPTGTRQCMTMQINLDNNATGLGPKKK